jgi:ankyrin repeat protein
VQTSTPKQNNGHDEVCRILIEKGIEKDAPNEISATALDLAIQARQLNAAIVLKNAGCTWSKDMTIIRPLIRLNQTPLLRLLGDLRRDASIIASAVEYERVEILEFLLEESVGTYCTVEIAKNLLQKSQNPQIKALLQKWINKQLGIPEVKKEEVEEDDVKPKKGGKGTKK